MARYITRVELHHATGDDYEKLHSEMEKVGFSRTILSSEGVSYYLPTAEYSKNSEKTIEEVRNLAVEAAKKTGKKHAVLVSEKIKTVWVGLHEV